MIAYKVIWNILFIMIIFMGAHQDTQIQAVADAGTYFDCTRFSDMLLNDALALEAAQTALVKDGQQFKLDCLTTLVQNNLFETNSFLLHKYFFDHSEYSNDQILEHVKKGIVSINKQYSKVLSRIDEELKKPVVMVPPFQWAQSLDVLMFEIKYAYRHDVAGCADLFNETVSISKDFFYVGAACKELDQTMYFELKFKLWDEVDPETVKYEKVPVGKHHITVQKLTRPARWRQLWLEDTAKPAMMKIWFDRFLRFLPELDDFEGDDIEDYAGYNLIDQPDPEEEEDDDDTSWLFPPKGPGEFKNLKKKKRGKKGKKKGKKSKKSKKVDL